MEFIMVGRALEQLCNGLRVLLAVLIGLLAIPVGMQVLARYTGIIPVYLWTEELATFIFVWAVMIGAIVAVWDGTHFDVRVIPDAKRPLLVLLQDGFVLIMILGFALIFFWYGIEYAKFGFIQNSVMMRANMVITHISVPIAGGMWTLFTGYRLYEVLVKYKNSTVDVT
jgi:TRAP-type C4-dicarboxylate transport system permease small subunit